MATVPDIIDDLGGAKAIATAISVPMTTVHSWKRVGYVPTWRIPALVAFAKKKGKPWKATDFPDRAPNETGVAA